MKRLLSLLCIMFVLVCPFFMIGCVDDTQTHTHNFELVSTTASCTSSGVSIYKCKGCEETKTENTDKLPHSYTHRVCSKCNYTPLEMFLASFSLNSVGGVQFALKIKNTSGKRIKYINFDVVLSNSVNDLILDEITRKSRIPVECVGYYEINEEKWAIEDIIAYNKNTQFISITDIIITYADGTKETVANNYRYEKWSIK